MHTAVVELQASWGDRIQLDEVTHELTPKTSVVDTTIGRALLFGIVPKGLPFLLNQAMKKKAINLINTAYRVVGLKDTVVFADQVMWFPF